MSTKKLLFVILACLALRLLLFGVIAGRNPERFFTPDSNAYWKIASHVINRHIFSMSDNAPILPDASRTPAYPLFISAFMLAGLGAKSVVLAQILLSTAVCAMVVLLAYKLTQNDNAAYFAGLITALDLPSVVLANSVLTETLFTFLLFAGFYLFAAYLRKGKTYLLLLAGTLAGISALCRPIAFLLPAVWAFLLMFERSALLKKRLLDALLLIVISTVVIAPWVIRNTITFGSPFISTIGNDNLLYFHAAGVVAARDGISLGDAADDLKEQLYRSIPPSAPVAYVTKEETKIAKEVILQNPVIYTRNFVSSMFNMLLKPIRSDIDFMLGLSSQNNTLETPGKTGEEGFLSRLSGNTSIITILLCVFQAAMLVVMYGTAFAGLFYVRRNPAIMAAAVTVAYFSLLSTIPDAYARFRVPIIPLAALLSAQGLPLILSLFSKNTGNNNG